MKKSKSTSPAPLWITFLYLSEGLPFTFLRTSVVPAFLKQMGASNITVGLTSLLGIPYTFKFLWSPLIDIFWKKRSWAMMLQFNLVLMLFVLSFLVLIPNAKFAWWTGFVICAFLSASQDIAIDGYYMDALDSKMQAAYAGFRNSVYRVAMMIGTSIPLMVQGKTQSWFYAFLSCALLLSLAFSYNFFFLPKLPPPPPVSTDLKKDPKEQLKKHLREYGEAFKSYLLQDRIILILIFILIYKLGDALLFSMNTPFLMDLGVTTFQLGWISGTAGKIFSILGSIGGGWWVFRKGLKKGLWQLALFMNLAILAYAWLAISGKKDESSFYFLGVNTFILKVFLIHSLEQFAAGVGTTAFVIFQMSTCKSEYKASHFAITSSIIAFGPMISGPIGGYLSSHFGYAAFFTVCFLVSIPGLSLIPFLPIREKQAYVPESAAPEAAQPRAIR